MRNQMKRSSKTRSFGHHWSNQRKRNAMNSRMRNLREREGFDLEIDWRFEARRSQTSWRKEKTDSCIDDWGRAY